MKQVYLHGRLKARFGGPFSLNIASVKEAVAALCANFPGLRGELAKGRYRVIVGSLRKGEEIEEDRVPFGLPPTVNVHIMPAIAGRKRGGLGKTIAGIALVGIAMVASGGALAAPIFAGSTGAIGAISWGSVALFGAAMAFGGVAQMLTPTPKAPSMGGLESPEQRPSFLLGGAVNVTHQGNPIPMIGGRMRVGGIIISSSITNERMPV